MDNDSTKKIVGQIEWSTERMGNSLVAMGQHAEIIHGQLRKIEASLAKIYALVRITSVILGLAGLLYIVKTFHWL
jgi:hypothetical protein